MLQTLCDELRPIAALGASGLLGVVIAAGSVTSAHADVRDIFSQPATATRATATATRIAKSTTPRSTSASRSSSASRSMSKSVDPKVRLVAQSESPLDRLRQRDVDQRLREAINEDSAANSAGFLQPDSLQEEPSERPATPKLKSLPETPPANSRTEPNTLPEPSDDFPRAGGVNVPEPLPMDDVLPEPITSPAHLKKIGEIHPYSDYQPVSSLKGDVCWDLCPRSDGSDCKADPETGLVPECPHEYRLGDQAYMARTFEDCLYQWQASDIYHNPLYFEDCSLERYGHTHHCLLQPFVSVGKFSVQLVGLPYQMAIDPAWKKMYTLGYYRPGECAPKKYYRVPWNTRAAVAEAGVWTGLIFLFP